MVGFDSEASCGELSLVTDKGLEEVLKIISCSDSYLKNCKAEGVDPRPLLISSVTGWQTA